MIENEDNNKEQVMVKSKDIICPQCKEPCMITTEDYKIKLYECINGHTTENIKFIDFADTQMINESEIKCDKCKFKNKGNCPGDEFFRCLTCKENLCLLCKPNHDTRHNIIRYDQRNYICQIHNEPLIKYCIQCKKNICFSCEGHENHKIEDLGNLKPNIEEKKKILSEFKLCIDKINKGIKEVIEELNGFMLYINKYYEINNNIVENYDTKRRNFQVLKNLKEINNNNKIIDIIKNINNNNIKDKIYDIIDLYNNMDKNKMTIIYNNNDKNKIKLFGEDFIKNNKDNCYLIINNKKQELTEYIEIKEQQKLEIKLYETKNITDMSGMFCNCSSLSSLPDISKWDAKNITDMSCMFRDCSSLSSLPDISKWDTKNVTNMHYMFRFCSSLNSLPDISKWNTKNVTDMSYMFHCCRSLN
jgi:surface protein